MAEVWTRIINMTQPRAIVSFPNAVFTRQIATGSAKYDLLCIVPCPLLSTPLTMVAVAVNLVVGDNQIVRVVVGVEPVQDVIAHDVVGPHAVLVTVRVHTVVHAVDFGALDVAVHAGALEYLRVGQVYAEASDLPAKTVALGVEKSHVSHHGIDDVLINFRMGAGSIRER